MDDKINEKRNDREYNKIVLESMAKLVEEKIDACKTGLPLILTIITTIIAYLFVEKYSSQTLFSLVIIAMVFLLLAFIALLLASFPNGRYKHINCFKKKTIKFSPVNIVSYWELTNEQFIQRIQEYLDTDFTTHELLNAEILKEKINEYRFKSLLLKIAYGVLIVGAMILVVIFFIGLFVL